MKKWIVMGIVGIVVIVGGLSIASYMGVQANDKVLEEIRTQDDVVILNVSGMT